MIKQGMKGGFMENEKRRMPVQEGLELLKRYIKLGALAAEAGKPAVWMSQRKKGTYRFTEQDVALLNAALGRMGWMLSCTRLSLLYPNPEGSLAEGDTVDRQLKSLQRTLAMDYLYTDTLGKDKLWMSDRLNRSDRYRFKPDEVERMNEAIAAAANVLMGTELQAVV